MILFLLFILPLFAREGDYTLTLLVDNRKLDYSTPNTLVRTLAKHPSDGSKNSDVGHAWILLEGEGKAIEIGFTGEGGEAAPPYFVGVSELFERQDSNPGRYLFTTLPDGHLHEGSGGHTPTTSACFSITPEAFQAIWNYIETYSNGEYSLVKNNCVTFVVQVASIGGIDLECRRTIMLPSLLWTDPAYKTLEFDCPDLLEEALRRYICERRAKDSLRRFPIHCQETFFERLHRSWNDLILLPMRIRRWLWTLNIEWEY